MSLYLYYMLVNTIIKNILFPARQSTAAVIEIATPSPEAIMDDWVQVHQRNNLVRNLGALGMVLIILDIIELCQLSGKNFKAS